MSFWASEQWQVKTDPDGRQVPFFTPRWGRCAICWQFTILAPSQPSHQPELGHVSAQISQPGTPGVIWLQSWQLRHEAQSTDKPERVSHFQFHQQVCSQKLPWFKHTSSSKITNYCTTLTHSWRKISRSNCSCVSVKTWLVRLHLIITSVTPNAQKLLPSLRQDEKRPLYVQYYSCTRYISYGILLYCE